jgi:hypothetical protein
MPATPRLSFDRLLLLVFLAGLLFLGWLGGKGRLTPDLMSRHF